MMGGFILLAGCMGISVLVGIITIVILIINSIPKRK